MKFNLSNLHHYLEIAQQTLQEATRTIHLYSQSEADRMVCLMWAAWMADSKSPNVDTPASASMDLLRHALYQVRAESATVDMSERKVACSDGEVIDFT